MLATSSADGSIKIWFTSDFTLVSEAKPNKTSDEKHNKINSTWIWDLAFTSDTKHLFSVSSDKMARQWEVNNCSIVKEYKGHQKPIVCMAFSDSKI